MTQPFAQTFRVHVKADSFESIAHDIFAKRPRMERVTLQVSDVTSMSPIVNPDGTGRVYCNEVIAVLAQGYIDVINQGDRDQTVDVCVQAVLLPAHDPWDPHPWRDRENFKRAQNETIGQSDEQAYAIYAKWHVRDLAWHDGSISVLPEDIMLAGVGAWTGGMWELAVEIVCDELPCLDRDDIKKTIEPYKLGDPDRTAHKLYVNGLAKRAV